MSGKIVKVEFKDITESDRLMYVRTDVLENRTKVVATDSDGNVGYSFIENSEIELFGKNYIKTHLSMSFSEALNDWFVKLNRDEYMNDLNHNPLRSIRVKFIEIEKNTGREVYKGIVNGRFYLREVHPKENFAQWFVCGRIRKTDDGEMPKPNLVFINDNQIEQVKYHDGKVAAWESTYNKDFRGVHD